MAYQRKTYDVWEIQQLFPGTGWEAVNAETTYKDARRSIQEYRMNQPEYAARLLKKRVRIETKGE